MPQPKPAGGGKKIAGQKAWVWGIVIVGGLLLGYFLLKRSSSSNQSAAALPATSAADQATAAPAVGGTPAPSDGGGSSLDLTSLLATLGLGEQNAVASELLGTIQSQDQLIGVLGTGAQTLAMTAEQQLGSIAGSAVNGLTSIAISATSGGSGGGGGGGGSSTPGPAPAAPTYDQIARAIADEPTSGPNAFAVTNAVLSTPNFDYGRLTQALGVPSRSQLSAAGVPANFTG